MLECARRVRDWNAHFRPGQSVYVVREDRSLFNTKTVSAAWVAGSVAVVMVAGIPGCYALARVHPLKVDAVADRDGERNRRVERKLDRAFEKYAGLRTKAGADRAFEDLRKAVNEAKSALAPPASNT